MGVLSTSAEGRSEDQTGIARHRAWSGTRPFLWLAVVVLLAQFCLVAKTLPLSAIWSEHPLFHIDGAFHWYNIKLGANLAAKGNLVGYDPFFAGGHVNGIHYNFSARVPTLFAALLSPGIDEIHIYKVYVLLAAVMAPLAVFAAAAALRLSAVEALTAAVLGILMWWVSYLRWYATAGMVGYVTMCYLAVLFVALVIRHIEAGCRTWLTVALGLFGAVAFFWHSLFPVPVAIFLLAYLLTNGARLDWPRTITALSTIAAISVAPNLPWLVATYRYSEASAPNSVQMVVDASRIGREFLGLLRSDAYGSKAYPLLFLASLWALTKHEIPGRRRLWFALLTGTAALELLAYLGAAIPGLGIIQPNRFAPAGYLFLCLPAARGLILIARLAVDKSAGTWQTFARGTALAVCVLGTVLTWELWREITPGPHGRFGASPPEAKPLGENSVWLMDWLARRTTGDSRVLFETSLARIHDQAHMAGYYAYSTQREFVGGPYPWMHFANFWDGSAFRRPIGDIPYDRMAEYLSLYNIGAIVAHSNVAKSYFDAMPGVRFDAAHGKLRTYLVEGAHSYFIKGSGHIQERGHNHLLITDIRGPELILKYHDVTGLVTDPPTTIQGIRMLDDPKPFVRVVDPPPRLRLYMR